MPAPELLIQVEEDLVQTILHLERFRVNEDGTADFITAATWDGQPVGFGFQLGAEWEPQAFENEAPVYWGTVQFTRTGPESDAFLRAFAEACEVEPTPEQMADGIEFSAASVAAHPRQFQQGQVQLKLFFNADEEADYTEFYCMIDHQRGRFEFSELELEFRDPLLRALAK